VAEKGSYSVYFVKCTTEAEHFVKLTVGMGQEDSSRRLTYLPTSLGEKLPIVYGSFYVAYLLAALVWIVYLVRASRPNLFGIHYLFIVLIVCQASLMVAKASQYFYQNAEGQSIEWSFMVFVFTVAKHLVGLVTLGVGWITVSGKRTRIFCVAIPMFLSILADISLGITDSSNPGGIHWLCCRQFGVVVDFICHLFYLIPLFWAIRRSRHYQQSEKLFHFRGLYLMALLAIFVRSAAPLIPFVPLEWDFMRYVVSEAAIYYVICSALYHLRPRDNNPCLALVDESTACNNNTVQWAPLATQDPSSFSKCSQTKV